jgi:hypothetical protein
MSPPARHGWPCRSAWRPCPAGPPVGLGTRGHSRPVSRASCWVGTWGTTGHRGGSESLASLNRRPASSPRPQHAVTRWGGLALGRGGGEISRLPRLRTGQFPGFLRAQVCGGEGSKSWPAAGPRRVTPPGAAWWLASLVRMHQRKTPEIGGEDVPAWPPFRRSAGACDVCRRERAAGLPAAAARPTSRPPAADRPGPAALPASCCPWCAPLPPGAGQHRHPPDRFGLASIATPPGAAAQADHLPPHHPDRPDLPRLPASCCPWCQALRPASWPASPPA